MPTTLLLDLDDTLLINSVDQFIPAYLRLFASYVGDLVDPKQFNHDLLSSTDRMIANNTIDQTLKQTFDKSFFPGFAAKQTQLKSRIEDFYREQFPTLQPLTRPREEAVQLVNFALAQGMNVVVATNPIFPRQAQLQRLKWAGMPISRYPFKLVTSYESLHFAKPNPAYFCEILAQLGWPNGPVSMVGDNLSDDILPANSLGIPTFLVKNPWHIIESVPTTITYEPMDQLKEWITHLTGEPVFANKSSILAGLRASPAAVHSLISNPIETDTALKVTLSAWITQENELRMDSSLFKSGHRTPSPTVDPSVTDLFSMVTQQRAELIGILEPLDIASFEPEKQLLQELIRIDQTVIRQIRTQIHTLN